VDDAARRVARSAEGGAEFVPGCDAAVARSEHAIGATLPGELDRAYRTIRSAAPRATVVVLGCARLFGDDVSCAAAHGVIAAEARKLNRIADDLDKVVAARAAAAGFGYVISLRRFAGHDMCTAVPGSTANSSTPQTPTTPPATATPAASPLHSPVQPTRRPPKPMSLPPIVFATRYG
jgi:hypothetical protein